MEITGPLHIPAKRPGFDTDSSVIRHPHPWGGSYEPGFESQYHTHSQFYLERERKPVYYGYPEAQFPQVCKNIIFFFFFSCLTTSKIIVDKFIT